MVNKKYHDCRGITPPVIDRKWARPPDQRNGCSLDLPNIAMLTVVLKENNSMLCFISTWSITSPIVFGPIRHRMVKWKVKVENRKLTTPRAPTRWLVMRLLHSDDRWRFGREKGFHAIGYSQGCWESNAITEQTVAKIPFVSDAMSSPSRNRPEIRQIRQSFECFWLKKYANPELTKTPKSRQTLNI